jgi:hypothetical protein
MHSSHRPCQFGADLKPREESSLDIIGNERQALFTCEPLGIALDRSTMYGFKEKGPAVGGRYHRQGGICDAVIRDETVRNGTIPVYDAGGPAKMFLPIIPMRVGILCGIVSPDNFFKSATPLMSIGKPIKEKANHLLFGL